MTIYSLHIADSAKLLTRMNDINIHNKSYAKNHIKFENEIDALLINNC